MKLKKILAVVLALVLVLAFAGCTKDNNDNDSSKADSSNAAGENVASKDGVIKIGSIGPLTGDNAQYGTAVKLGAELAVKEINAAGGINGYKVEFKMEDDVCDGEKAVIAYNNLKDWGMQMLVGTVTSGACIAVSAESEADNMFLLTPSGSAVECIPGDTQFRVCFSDPNQGIGAADYIAEKALATKVGIIYNSSEAYSTGIKDKFVEEAAVKGVEIVAQEAFTSDNATDFSAQVANIQAAGADLVFLPIYYTPASLIMKQAKSVNYNPIFFGSDGMDGILGMDNIDPALVEGVMYLTPFMETATDTATVNFVKGFKENYPNDTQYLNQFGADAYDAVYAIKKAAEKANITADMDVAAIGDAMKVAMTEITIDGVTGSGMTWGADGEPVKMPRVAKIVNGTVEAA